MNPEIEGQRDKKLPEKQKRKRKSKEEKATETLKKKEERANRPKKPRGPMSEETKAKIRLARANVKVQPRAGKSKYPQTFYDELLSNYKNNDEAVKWIKENEYEFTKRGYKDSEVTKEIGIRTQKDEVFDYWRQIKVGSLLFDNEKDRYREKEYTEIDKVEDNIYEEQMVGNVCDEVDCDLEQVLEEIKNMSYEQDLLGEEE